MNGGVLFSDAEVAFIASTYRVVVLSACVGSLNVSVASAIFNVTGRIKAQNPSIKVMQYFNMQMWACYNNQTDPDYKTFLANPQWWLRDDTGVPVMNNGSPQYDWQNLEAVAHWLLMPISRDGVTLDGFLLDGAAVYDPEARINPTRAEALKLAKWRAVGQMQQRLTTASGGMILANGMAGGPIDPHVNDPFNLQVLGYAQCIEN